MKLQGIACLLLLVAGTAFAVPNEASDEEPEGIEASERLSAIADKMARDEATQTITLVGHAKVTQDEIQFLADKIVIDKGKAIITGEGNCEFDTAGPKWKASQLSFRVADGVWELIEEKNRQRLP